MSRLQLDFEISRDAYLFGKWLQDFASPCTGKAFLLNSAISVVFKYHNVIYTCKLGKMGYYVY